MNRKKLTWHAKNMEEIACRTANNRDTAYIWAIACAVKFILEELEKNESRNRKCIATDAHNSNADVVDERQMTWEEYGDR